MYRKPQRKVTKLKKNSEQPGPGAMLLGWPKSLYNMTKLKLKLFDTIKCRLTFNIPNVSFDSFIASYTRKLQEWGTNDITKIILIYLVYNLFSSHKLFT